MRQTERGGTERTGQLGAFLLALALLLVLTLTFGVYGSGYRAADFIYGRF